MNLLTGGKDSSSRARVQAPLPKASQPTDNSAELATLKAQVAHLEASLKEAREAHEAVCQALEQERGRANSLAAQVNEEVRAHGDTKAELAAAKASASGLTAQLSTEREARQVLDARLQQAIAAAQPKPAPKAEPPSYELTVVEHDANSRMRKVLLTPVKKG